MDSLTTLMGKIQATLGGDGTRFPIAICTAAVRLALDVWNLHAPIHAGTLIDVEDGEHEYALNASDFTGLLEVLDVLYNEKPIGFVQYYFDNAPYIRLDQALAGGQLDIRFTLPHTISGLDSKVESTLDPAQDVVLLNGACAQALYIRATSRVEASNLDKAAMDHYREIAGAFIRAFKAGLARYASRPMPQEEREARTWEDEWHGFGEG